MTGLEAKLANITAIEQYGNVMKSKGLHSRAKWAYEQARRLRSDIELASGFVLPKAA